MNSTEHWEKSFVGAGFGNTAYGDNSCVVSGTNNIGAHENSFVWGGSSHITKIAAFKVTKPGSLRCALSQRLNLLHSALLVGFKRSKMHMDPSLPGRVVKDFLFDRRVGTARISCSI